ncbi:NDP-sugar epimerase [Thermoplasma volcanium GSS1]|uniref:NDP-sugar epimerase n=1 Tax=Thermoplasma volcanium (strain ATCC 51530 / DSM 4299 / JCM 9571 / NBRC 15438 / GSS1) TaxID=273116 RepID=Q97A85_THEVO|nr:NAD-dependent epimerase/dehydratase family protein [Thermoplasma volcanium]BAB60067.1 NDP-sugar epimerase [Thermoplasma volcanium GSS1]
MMILVTGHRGFIGSHIYSYFNGNSEVYGFDIGDKLEDRRYDVIIHMAARGLIRKSIEFPYDYFQDDLSLVVRFLELARKNDSVFIFPSSGSTAEPTNPYSLAKKNAEEWIRLYGKLYGLKYYILRFFNIYGDGAKKGAVYLFTKAALSGEEAIVYGDGSHIRDFLYVGDVPITIERILNEKYRTGEYEVGSGKGTSVNDLISLIEKVTGKKIRTRHEDYIVPEASELVAKNTIVKNPTPLEVGVERVMEFILKDNQ